MLLNTISKDTEKIIWEYYHLINNLDKKIKNILECNFFGFLEYDKKNGLNINLIDFLESYSNMIKNFKYKKPIRIKFKKNRSLDKILNNNKDYYHIDENNINEILKNNKKFFNCNITQIIKLYHSNTIYILI